MSTQSKCKWTSFLPSLVMTIAFSVTGLTGCDSTSGSGLLALTNAVQPNPVFPPTTTPLVSLPTPPQEPTCVSTDSHSICIAVKVVSYKDSRGVPALSQKGAEIVVQEISDIWKACDIGFQVEEYVAIDPTAYGLQYGAGSANELQQIRQKFSNDKTFFLGVTGSWTTSAIAWTALPGGGPYGAVVDADYAADRVAVGHEIGHYQGLDHNNTSGNLMYPIVYSNDTTLTTAQCNFARQTDQVYWQAMLRH